MYECKNVISEQKITKKKASPFSPENGYRCVGKHFSDTFGFHGLNVND